MPTNIDVVDGTINVTDFRRSMSARLGWVRRTKKPLQLIAGGQVEAIILDPEVYQNMVDQLEELEAGTLMQLASAAENAPKLSYAQVEERIMRNRAARTAQMQGAAESA